MEKRTFFLTIALLCGSPGPSYLLAQNCVDTEPISVDDDIAELVNAYGPSDSEVRTQEKGTLSMPLTSMPDSFEGGIQFPGTFSLLKMHIQSRGVKAWTSFREALIKIFSKKKTVIVGSMAVMVTAIVMLFKRNRELRAVRRFALNSITILNRAQAEEAQIQEGLRRNLRRAQAEAAQLQEHSQREREELGQLQDELEATRNRAAELERVVVRERRLGINQERFNRLAAERERRAYRVRVAERIEALERQLAAARACRPSGRSAGWLARLRLWGGAAGAGLRDSQEEEFVNTKGEYDSE